MTTVTVVTSNKPHNYIHGHAGDGRRRRSPTYNSWRAMIGRCTYPTHPRYPDYGGRGITVCDRWRKFVNFLADMGERPDGMTLDRDDVHANYTPENCRWATPIQQRWNRRDMNSAANEFTDDAPTPLPADDMPL